MSPASSRLRLDRRLQRWLLSVADDAAPLLAWVTRARSLGEEARTYPFAEMPLRPWTPDRQWTDRRQKLIDNKKLSGLRKVRCADITSKLAQYAPLPRAGPPPGTRHKSVVPVF